MRVRDRHDHYLRGFMSQAEMERYEAQVSTRPALAAELAERLGDDEAWDPEMLARARALLSVSAAWFELVAPPAGTAKLNLLGREEPFDLAPYEIHPGTEEEEEAPFVEGIETDEATLDRLLDGLLSGALRVGAEQVEVIPGGNSVRVMVNTGDGARPMMLVPRHFHEPFVQRLKELADIPAEPLAAPQRGRLSYHYDGRDYRIWVCFEATAVGEIVTLTFVPGP